MNSHASAEVRVVRPDHDHQGRQGLTFFDGISAETAGSTGLCLHRLVVPPGGRAKAHLHASHESAIYVIEGEVRMFWGDNLEHSEVTSGGDFIYIPAGVPHLPVNLSASAPAVALVARTDPNEQENVVLLPELDDLPQPH